MLDRRLFGRDYPIGLDHRLVHVRTAVRLQRSEFIRNPFPFAHRPKRQSPIPRRIKGENADLVRGIHDIRRRHRRGLGQIQLRAPLGPRAHAAGLVENEDHRHVRQIEPRGRPHVHRQNSFKRRAIVAAGAVTLRSADDEESAAQVADIFFNGFHFAIGKLKSGHIVEDQEIE